MAKIKHSDLINAALSEHSSKVEEKENSVDIIFSLSNRRKGFISCGFKPETIELPSLTGYPVSITDQVHALTLSQQVRQGIGDSDSELDKNSFDFPDGIDDGSDAHGIFELSNRVDAWLAEQKLSEDLKASFRSQVLQRQADKAMKDTLAKQTVQQVQKVQQTNQSNQNTSK